MGSNKKPLLSFSPLLSIITTALFFVGLTLTMAMIPSSSFVVVFADGTQRMASPHHGFVSTTTDDDSVSFNIPISRDKEDGGGQGEDDEKDEDDEREGEDNAR